MGVMKTPSVYIVEKKPLPHCVVAVPTTVPAFVGYTERADDKGRSLRNAPQRIASLREFEKYFGGPPNRCFDLTLMTTGASAAGETTVSGSAAAERKPIVINQGDYSLAQACNRYLLCQSIRLFYQNGGGSCYVVSVGDYTKLIEKDDLTKGIDVLVKEQEPTMVVIPEAVMLDKLDDCAFVQQAALRHCGQTMKNRVAILDIFNGDKELADNPVKNFRDKLGTEFLSYGMAYYPWLNTTVASQREFGFRNIHQANDLKALITQELKGGTPEQQAELTKITWSAQAWSDEAAKQDATVADLQMQLGQTLAAMSPRYKTLVEQMAFIANLLPPSAAMAGIYTKVDNNLGVWKAPANVSLTAVASPAVNISDIDLENLKDCTTGKSVNAIRSLKMEGTLVLGARTLDGNSLNWRYINVRRTMIMLEESIRLVTKSYMFEPNVDNTWITIKSMIRNFLTGIWKEGGLAGAVPEDGFGVFVGLGETMAPEDILDGILRVTVLVAVSQPTEFIEITFEQQMQKS